MPINETEWVIADDRYNLDGVTFYSSLELAWDEQTLITNQTKAFWEGRGYRAVQVRIEEVAPKAADEREVCECGSPQRDTYADGRQFCMMCLKDAPKN